MRVGKLDKVCPRCAGDTTNQHGALSRTDNETLVCDECGTREALEEHYFGAPVPKVLWQSNTRVFDVGTMKFDREEK